MFTRKLPGSAKRKYTPVKLLGTGKDGIVVLAVPNTGPQTTTTAVALKLLDDERIGTVSKTLLDNLSTLRHQHQTSHLIASVIDYSPGLNWYCMNYIPGLSVDQLFQTTYAEHGMPPALTFHIMQEVVQAQSHLQELGLGHIDLKEGGNVMLSPRENDAWLSVTVVDFGGIKPYNEFKVAEHTVGLFKRLMRHNSSVQEYWRGDDFSVKDLDAADRVYGDVMRIEFDRERKLETIWQSIKVEVGRLKEVSRNQTVLGALRGVLEGEKITDEEVRRLVGEGGLTMEDDPIDVGMTY